MGNRVESEDKAMLKKIIGVCGIALGISTAGSEIIFVPFVLMGIGFLALMGVAEWE